LIKTSYYLKFFAIQLMNSSNDDSFSGISVQVGSKSFICWRNDDKSFFFLVSIDIYV